MTNLELIIRVGCFFAGALATAGIGVAMLLILNRSPKDVLEGHKDAESKEIKQ